MRERCRLFSRYQCIRYVVSYPRLSRMTRRNGTAAYLRFCGRAERDVALRAVLVAARRGAAALAFAAGFRRAGAGAVRRAGAAARGRAASLRPDAAAFAFGAAAAAGGAARLPSDAPGARCTSVKRIWSPTA